MSDTRVSSGQVTTSDSIGAGAAGTTTSSTASTVSASHLLTSSNVPGTEIKVETVNGVVSLSGTVATQAEKDKAVTTAKGIKGVTRVDAAALKVSAAAKR